MRRCHNPDTGIEIFVYVQYRFLAEFKVAETGFLAVAD